MFRPKKKQELVAQRTILGAVRELKGFGCKLSHRTMVGVPDLLIKLRGYPATLIEVKCPIRPVVVPIPVTLTPQQRKFMREYQSAGGYMGWAVVVAQSKNGFFLYAGVDANTEHLTSDMKNYTLIGAFGKQYLVRTVQNMIRYVYETHQEKGYDNT